MTSPSTLSRKAAKTKNPKQAKRLREKAAFLRREARATQKLAKEARAMVGVIGGQAGNPNTITPAGAADPALQAMVNDLMTGAARDGTAFMEHRQARGGWQKIERPGQGEIVGGRLSQEADHVAKLARQKGGKDAIQQHLEALETAAKLEGKFEGARAAEERFREERIAASHVVRDKVVCGFLAEVEYGIAPGTVLQINSFTLGKIVDVLSAAGYSAKGRR